MTKAEQYVTFLRGFKGYLEKETDDNLESFTANAGDENFTMFGKWYDDFMRTTGFNGEAWCMDFQTYGAYKNGLGPDKFPYTASCGEAVGWFKKHGLWHPRLGYIPKIGDLVFFHTGDGRPKHVGAVYEVTDNKIRTIEGNTSGTSGVVPNGGGVNEKSYFRDYDRILGYGTPNYNPEEDEEDMTGEKIWKELDAYLMTQKIPDWAEEDFAKAVEMGITDGKNPMTLVPRYQAAIMAMRAAEEKEK